MAVIYRKYRPQTFEDVTGQEHVRKILMEQIIRATVAHAYLFTGPRGVGKTTSARLLAKAINCIGRKKTDSEPCGTCNSCVAITDGRALDVIEIDAASHSGVDEIKETVVETARFAPTQLLYKVYIIDEVHSISAHAWNALLKMIEEPPKHVIFILATTEVHKVPATILSRCQRFDFKRVPVPVIIERLAKIAKAEGVKIDDAVLAQVARLAEGGLRDAETLLGQLMALGLKKISVEEASLVIPVSALPRVITFIRSLGENNSAAALTTLTALLEDGFDLYQFGRETLEVVRQLLLMAMAGPATIAGQYDHATEEELVAFSRMMAPQKIHWILEVLNRRVSEIKHATILLLPLELAVFEICMPEGEQMQNAPSEPAGQVKLKMKKEEESVEEIIKDEPAESYNLKPETSLPDDHGFLGQLKAAWQSVIGKVAAKNPSLPFVLQMSEPISIAAGLVSIGVRYPFHRDKLNEEKNRQLMDVLLSTEFGRPLRVEGILLPKRESDGLLDEALNVFGGSVLL